ncbi:MAG: TonB-dependent receptor [Thermodesulfobacteriota bacterium]|nr:MAG: TonB-dependent receptor [Thermodesulfobacteriota bacterium]
MEVQKRKVITGVCGLLTAFVVSGAAVAGAAESESVESKGVFVTATKTEVSLEDVPASVTVITREDIESRPARDIVDAIRDVPGITLSGKGLSGRETIRLRGFDSKHVLLMVDGRRITASDEYIGHSDYGFTWIPLEDIERIEVVRGPASSLYGSDAMGGVVNIITRPVGKEWRGSISAMGGKREDGRGGDEYQLGLSLTGPIVQDRLGLKLSVQNAWVGATPSAIDSRISELEGKDLLTGTAGITLSPVDGHRFELTFTRGDEERWRNTFNRNNTILHVSSYDLTREQNSLSYHGEFGAARVSANAYQNSLKAENRTDNALVAPTESQKLIDRVADAQLTIPLGKKQLVTFGGEFREEILEHAALAGGEGKAINRAIFLQDEIFLTDALSVTIGARNDSHAFFGSELSPKGYIVYHANPQWTFKAGYGEGFRAPTLKQISPEYIFVGPYTFTGNPDLKPERSQSYEAGAEYRAGALSAQLTVFRNEIDDLIMNVCVSNCLAPLGRVYEHLNVEKARTQGTELVLGYAFQYGIDVSFNHSWLEADDLTNNRALAERPRHAASLRVDWSEAPWGLKPQVRGVYTGEQVVYNVNTPVDLPAYTLWHMNVRKEIAPGVELGVGIENLTDERLSDKSRNFTTVERGRFYYASLRAQF